MNAAAKFVRRKSILNTQGGFTMIEIIMVIAIIGILSTIFYSKAIDSLQNTRLMAATDKLKDDIRFIYNHAVAQHDTTWLVVDVNNQKYGIYAGSTALNRQLLLSPATNEPGEVLMADVYPGIEITSVNFSGGSEFYFDWWGTPSTGGTVVLNETRVITLVPETGYVYDN